MEPSAIKPGKGVQEKGAVSEKATKMRKCYDYMSNLKSVLTKEEYAQYLTYLKLLKDNYLKEKILFYSTVAFQIFFPSDMKSVLDNYAVRKSLFAQSKYFFPKGDREAYSLACNELMVELDANVKKYLTNQEKRLKNSQKTEKKAVKLQPPVFIDYQRSKPETYEISEDQIIESA